MVGAYVNKRRYAPQGYTAVTKPLARQLYNAGVAVTLCGNNVNSFHVFGGWHLGCTITKDWPQGYESFDDIVSNFLSYLDHELGTYSVFYVKTSDLPAKD